MQANADANAGRPERRSARRARTLKGGRIIINGGYSGLGCTVRNITEGGAMLQLGETIGVPTRFELEIEPSQPRRQCTVRWRTETHIGVSFD